jgi:hypothetical protein
MAAVLAAVLAVALSGCATARAHTAPDLPPLAVPSPPERALPPLEGGPIEAAVPAAPQPPPARPAARPRSEPRNGDTLARADAAAVDPAPAEVAPDASRPPEEPAAAPTLRLMPGGESPASEERVRQQISRAQQDLTHVDYKALNADAREQYDTAKRFVAVAEQAIKDRNLIFAQTLADKAATIAAVLLRR